jgi:hypothetical protein
MMRLAHPTPALNFRPSAVHQSVPNRSIGLPLTDEAIGDFPSDAGFVALRAAYRASGGTARGDDLARLLEDCRNADFESLARLIVSGEAFGFDWKQAFWVPMFQFDLNDLTLKKGPVQVLAELSAAFEGWALAAWYVQPNAWLCHRRPVDLIDSQLADVLAAARADRFVAIG